MKKLFRPLAVTAALGCAGVVGLRTVHADGPPKPADKPAADGAAAAPIKFTNEVVKTRFAVEPKPLTDSIKKGVDYLLKSQQADGGWAQGGGWRTAGTGQGGRVEGAKVEDPSDVGNSCFALLALIRAGSTPTDGPHKDAVQKGLRYLFTMVEKADKDSLYVTDVRNTQLQSKIGPFVDTFLANLVLAELKGKAGADEPRLTACLEKTMTKIVRHQNADGQFANNGGWAPVLSLAICNKGLSRAKLNGVAVDDKVIARVRASSEAVAMRPAAAVPAGEAVAAAPAGRPVAGPAPATPALPAVTRPAAEPAAVGDLQARAPGLGGLGGVGGGGTGDAGVKLYSLSQQAGNYQDVVNSLKVDAEKARQVLKDANATKEQKAEAQKRVTDFEGAERRNGEIQRDLAANVRNEQFVAGFGSNGGEEFLSFLQISESLVVKGGKEWDEWDGKMRKAAEKAQDKDGSWAGHHCITGKTFCTAGALLVMLADRTPFPEEVLNKAQDAPKPDAASDKK